MGIDCDIYNVGSGLPITYRNWGKVHLSERLHSTIICNVIFV